ncbi:unnamed protein product [Closterium sp. NIES-53]
MNHTKHANHLSLIEGVTLAESVPQMLHTCYTCGKIAHTAHLLPYTHAALVTHIRAHSTWQHATGTQQSRVTADAAAYACNAQTTLAPLPPHLHCQCHQGYSLRALTRFPPPAAAAAATAATAGDAAATTTADATAPTNNPASGRYLSAPVWSSAVDPQAGTAAWEGASDNRPDRGFLAVVCLCGVCTGAGGCALNGTCGARGNSSLQ